jgi:hypothetical protein
MERNSLEKLSARIGIYLFPEYFKEGFINKINFTIVNKKGLEKYFQLLNNIGEVYKKILRYELYFLEFYPKTEEIRNTEALKHHIYTYLEDLTILENKIITFLGALKNDLKKTASNKKEIDEAMKYFIEAVSKVFSNVATTRNPHHHSGILFIEGNLLSSDATNLLLQNNITIANPEIIRKVKEKGEDYFEKAKNHWVGVAKNNNKGISDFIEDVFKRVSKYVYIILNINPVDIPDKFLNTK